MEIFDSLEKIKGKYPGCVMVLGTFDGVHTGHQQVIRHALHKAEAAGRKMVVMTFANHPLSVLAPEKAPLAIDDTLSRHQAFKLLGVEILLELTFTKELAALSAAEFLRQLQEYLAPSMVVVGPNNTFGRKGEGTPAYLEANAAKYGMQAEVCKPFLQEGEVVSSTKVRYLLMDGKLQEAQRLLGRYYRITGSVMHGFQRGRTIGFPTANISLPPQHLALPDGVYAVRLELDGTVHYGMASMGSNPTFGANAKTLEVNIFDFHGDIYGRTLTVEFVQRIRGMITFDGINALQERLRQDEKECRKIFGLH